MLACHYRGQTGSFQLPLLLLLLHTERILVVVVVVGDFTERVRLLARVVRREREAGLTRPDWPFAAAAVSFLCARSASKRWGIHIATIGETRIRRLSASRGKEACLLAGYIMCFLWCGYREDSARRESSGLLKLDFLWMSARGLFVSAGSIYIRPTLF